MVGDTVTEEAIASDNYDLDDDSVKSLSLQKEGNEIIFYYMPAVTTYTVRYVDVTTGEYIDIIEPEIGTGNVGSTVTKTMKSFDGYNLWSSSRITRTLLRNEEDNVFIFEYIQIN